MTGITKNRSKRHLKLWNSTPKVTLQLHENFEKIKPGAKNKFLLFVFPSYIFYVILLRVVE